MMNNMSKILTYIFVSFLFFTQTFANNEIKIISRSKWWANETYRYLDSPEWKKIIENRKKTQKKELTETQKKEIAKESRKKKIANNFLVSNFTEIFDISSTTKYENNHKLAWPIKKIKKKNSIIIHHTDNNYTDSFEAIKKIYEYHTLKIEWWDIWYNYLIWLDWEIFEWRAGWDYVAWAHDKWNNQWSIWIAVIWNYQDKPISKNQYKSLEKLISHLQKKHNIDYNKKVPFFKRCLWKKECETKPIEVVYNYPVIGHSDAWYTKCPWEELYKQIQILRDKLRINSYDPISKKYKKLFSKISEDKLIRFLAILEEKIDSIKNKKQLKQLKIVKNIILDIEKALTPNPSPNERGEYREESFDENNKIKVKLSYPEKNKINIKLKWNLIPKITKKQEEYILYFIKNPKNLSQKFNINLSFSWSQFFLNNRLVKNFSLKNRFRIKSPEDSFLTISSWDRKPSWDEKDKYNDNKFRGDLIVYRENILWDEQNEMVVVNELFLNDYLKWLWEVSNFTKKEKIKTIIVLARTYTRWYMTKAKKFDNKWYHASDDPNIFQKYLGLWLEERSPRVNSVVEETKDLVVTYNWELIKPWYFSSSSWYTKDFVEFCKTAKWVPDCEHSWDFSFLSRVKDPLWEQKLWHWVWVPGTWVEYFAKRWWIFPMIIKYFLKGVEVERME